MRRFQRVRAGVFALMIVCLAWITSARAAEHKPVDAALAAETTVDFQGVTLIEALKALDLTVPTVMDRRKLQEAGINLDDISVTLKLDGVPLRDALGKLLEPHQLAWIIRHDVLLITSAEAAAQDYYDTRIYQVTRRVPVERRLRSIMWSVAPQSWVTSGGKADASAVPPKMMMIYQTAQRHQQIEQEFAKSIAVVRAPTGKRGGKGRVEKALQSPTKLDFVDVSLSDALKTFQRQHELEFVLDEQALKESGIDSASLNVTLQAGTVSSLESGLSLLLEMTERQLEWVVDDGHIRVTSAEAAALKMARVTYGTKEIATGEELRRLMEAIEFTVASPTWEFVGGEGTLEADPENASLSVSQSEPVHRQLRRLLADMRAGANDEERNNEKDAEETDSGKKSSK